MTFFYDTQTSFCYAINLYSNLSMILSKISIPKNTNAYVIVGLWKHRETNNKNSYGIICSMLLLQLILINIPDFFWLNTQIGKGLFLSAMIKTFHQGGQIGSEAHTLMISPCLPQGMGAVISL